MVYHLDSDYIGFPNPEESEPNGLIAVGGDLSPLRLLSAYCSGIFPWYSQGEPLLWWSLNPRMVLFPDEFRYSKSLRRVVRSRKFEVRIDTCFEQVMRRCGTIGRQGQEGTWITEEMVHAYVELHRLGFAHSFETFFQGELVGGLYGVSVGDIFCGESMFHTLTDASKVALVRLVDFCRAHHFRLIDAQQETRHLASLGARPIARRAYLEMLDTLVVDKSLWEKWTEL